MEFDFYAHILFVLLRTVVERPGLVVTFDSAPGEADPGAGLT